MAKENILNRIDHMKHRALKRIRTLASKYSQQRTLATSCIYGFLTLIFVACSQPTPPLLRATPSIERPATLLPGATMLPATAVPTIPADTTPEQAPLPSASPDASIPTAAASQEQFFDGQRLSYEPGFYGPQIQAFLNTQPGKLKQLSYQIGGQPYSFADLLLGQTLYYSINPRLILALLESQSGLLSTPQPTSDQIGWAIGFQGDNGNWRGLQAQTRWAVRQMFYARRDYPAYVPLSYADKKEYPAPAGWSLSEYVIARVLAPTTTPERLPTLMQRFRTSYTALFGDPGLAPQGWPAPARPFLVRPLEKTFAITSFFDHDGPFLTRNPSATVVTYWGRAETDNSFAYDGHDGWDYAAAPPDMAIAAAAGTVIFAGTADDGCATRAVIIDHGNGYRTLYWHLARVSVENGQAIASGEPIGMVGETGCANGPHLHFGVQYLGRNVDPYGWCAATPDPWMQNPAGAPSTWLWSDRPSPCDPAPAGAVVVDTGQTSSTHADTIWKPVPSGYGGEALFAPSVRGVDEARPWELRPLTRPVISMWRPSLPKAGSYRVLAYIPYALSGLEDSRHMQYRIQHANGETDVVIDARTMANDWADLGSYQFTQGNQGVVILSNLTEESRLSVWADAIMWIPEP